MKFVRWNTLTAAALAAVLASLWAPPVRAQGWIEPDTHRWRPDFRVERLRSDVRIRVDGELRVAHVEVEEVFRNDGPVMLEGDYLYPIPPEAVFSNFSLFMGEQELRGEVLPADEARRIYEEIVRRKKDPALIELVGHGVLRARVFPVDPGDTRRVILRYTQVLDRDGDLLRLRYPRLVTRRPGDVREVAVVDPRSRREHPFTLTVTLTGASRFATPYSPTHTIDVRERGRDELEIVHRGEGAARDFDLFLPFRESHVGASLIAHAPGGEPGYFMLLIAPPAAEGTSQIPRDVTLVLDVSGSMSGAKIEQARQALEGMLASLRPDDRFRVITFSSVVRSFRSEFAAATRANLRAAREYLAAVQADGSTNVMDALHEALAPEARPGRLSLVVFLTDGKPTVGETDPERIAGAAERLRDGERVFAFGVGYDVNTYLLDRLAEGGRGTVTYVGPGDDVESAVASLTRKISHPALSDLRIVRAPAELEDDYPDPLPDLFYGEELLLFGRYRGHGAGELVLEGTRAGERQRLSYKVELPEREGDNDFIPRLWAARKAGALTAQVRLHGADPELVEEIRQLGLRYGILTEYTSYLVEEPELALNRPSRDVALSRAQQAAAAPEEQVGAAAFEAAKRSSRLREAEALDAADEALVALSAKAEGRGGSARTTAVRRAGRRLFALRDGTWTDLSYDDSLKVIEVAPFSRAYFQLLERLPALAPYLALGERVIVAGHGVALKLAPDGLEEWDGRSWNAVLDGFQGGL